MVKLVLHVLDKKKLCLVIGSDIATHPLLSA